MAKYKSKAKAVRATPTRVAPKPLSATTAALVAKASAKAAMPTKTPARTEFGAALGAAYKAKA